MDELKPKISVSAAVARGALSQVPVIGPIANEIIGQVIPDRRIARLSALYERLEQRVADLEPAILRDRFRDPVFVDLLEDGMFAAARARSSERIEYISEIIARGLESGDARKIDRAHLMGVLSEINDSEVLLLVLHGKQGEARRAFWERHQEAIEVPDLYFGERAPTKAAIRAIRSNYERHLERVGLLRREGHSPRPGEPLKFRPDGQLDVHSWAELSSLGYLLIREIGQPADIDVFGEAGSGGDGT